MIDEMPLSTFALSDLALQSAVELAKAGAGAAFNPEPVHELADALSKTVSPAAQDAQFRFVEPGYYEPFERLYHSEKPARADTVEALQGYFQTIVDRLRAFDHQAGGPPPVDDLKVFCVALHRELIRELTSDGAFARPNWRSADLSSSFGFG